MAGTFSDHDMGASRYLEHDEWEQGPPRATQAELVRLARTTSELEEQVSYNPAKHVGGFLMKRQDGKGQWLLRWTELTTDKISYFEKRGDSVPRKELNLLDCVDVEVAWSRAASSSPSPHHVPPFII